MDQARLSACGRATLLAITITCCLSGCGTSNDKGRPVAAPSPAPRKPASVLPLVVQAEGGDAGVLVSAGASVTVERDSMASSPYVTAAVNLLSAPTAADDPRITTLGVTFPAEGHYELYVRLRIGSDGPNDDSFFVRDSLGRTGTWRSQNDIGGFPVPGVAGYDPAALVDATKHITRPRSWMWTKLGNIIYRVKKGELYQEFQFATREDGLDLDRFVFSPPNIVYTTAQLDAGEAGFEIGSP